MFRCCETIFAAGGPRNAAKSELISATSVPSAFSALGGWRGECSPCLELSASLARTEIPVLADLLDVAQAFLDLGSPRGFWIAL